MRFQCSSSEMSAALGVVTRALSPRASSPIYEGVLLVTCPEGVRLTCTDLALGIETHIDVQVQDEGSVVLPGKLFSEIVRKLPDGMMDLSVDDRNVATIRCAGSRMTLAGMDPEEFPALPEVENPSVIKIAQNTFRDMVQRTSFAIATDETRIILTGCLLETEGSNLYLVALDGFQLALRKHACEEELPKLSAVVPGKVLGELAKILEDSDDEVELHFGKSYLTADVGPTRVVARLLEGEFIRYRQILPQDWKTRVRVSRRELDAAVDRAALMARENKNNLIKMHIGDSEMLITSNAELGDVREEVPVTSEGHDLDIAFNVRYIADTLRAIEDDEVLIRFNSNVSPCLFCPVEGDNYLYLALPVRVFSA